MVIAFRLSIPTPLTVLIFDRVCFISYPFTLTLIIPHVCIHTPTLIVAAHIHVTVQLNWVHIQLVHELLLIVIKSGVFSQHNSVQLFGSQPWLILTRIEA